MIKYLSGIKDSIYSFRLSQRSLFSRNEKQITSVSKELGSYVTWSGDPTTEVMLHYQVESESVVENKQNECLYRKQGDEVWIEQSIHADKEYPLTSKRVKWFRLTDLEPDTVYETRLKYQENIHTFKTMPATFDGVKVLLTSDQINARGPWEDNVEQGAEAIKHYSPDVYAIAGDLVHDDGRFWRSWDAFWDGWFKHITDKDGHMIPIVVTLGNHEGRVVDENGDFVSLLWESGGAKKEHVTFLYNFFSNLGESGYNTTDIADYFSIIALDSGHTNKVQGAQTDWLETQLSERQDGRYILPLMHVPPYPTRYTYNTDPDSVGGGIIHYWTPLFKNYGVKLAGVGHEHVSMVTKKVAGTEVNQDGAIYVGQGISVGSNVRNATITSEKWYVDYMKDATHGEQNVRGFIGITYSAGKIKAEIYNLNSEVVYSKELE